MVKKILFVNGPSQDPSDRFFGWPTSLLYAIAPTVDSIKNGKLDMEYVSKIFDPIWYVEGENSDEITEEFLKIVADVDVVAASATYDSLYPTLELFFEAKKQNPTTKTILGGPHFDEVHTISSMNNALNAPHLIDFAVAGDGEYVLEAILQSITTGTMFKPEEIPGKAWIYFEGTHEPTSGNPIDLNGLPFMPIELVAVERHKHDFDVFTDDKGILPTVQMIAQRGCPYTCNFCSERSELADPNSRSIESIVEEIELRKSQGFRAIFFDDSTFGAYPHLDELLTELVSTGMTFGSLNRFNHLTDRDLAQKYRDAGFTYAYCSIEQFDDDSLRQMQKGQSAKSIERSMHVLHETGFNLGVSLLYGLPYETQDSIKRTLDFTQEWVRRGLIKIVSESVLSYHPGTPAGDGKTGMGFVRTPPNRGYPFDRFEEGQWYHPSHVTAEYLEELLTESEQRFGDVMVRNRHSWYAEKGLLLA